MAGLELRSASRCFGGWQRFYTHDSVVTKTPMRFSVYLPPRAEHERCPVLWYLSGLTCTEENVVTKSGFQRRAAERGLVVIAPDTSPRGAGIEGEEDDWDFGTGAGFYVDATEAPWSSHYRMFSYVTEELPALVAAELPVDAERQGISGHSMGGHGALVAGLRLPERYRSLSAFAPIGNPSKVPWGEKAFTGYLGHERAAWDAYDAVRLLEQGRRARSEILVDQGAADGFLTEQLQPERLRAACERSGQPLTLRLQEGYDHSYYFVASFIDDHIDWHADRLTAVT